MTDAYAADAALTRIESSSYDLPFTAGKYDCSDDCWKLFAGNGTLAVAIVDPLASYSVSDAFAGALPRFTRPMFVRYAAFDWMPVTYSVCSSAPSSTPGTDC